MDKQIEFLIKLRDAGQLIADAANEYLDAFAPPTAKDAAQPAAVQEATFSTLRFEPQQGAKLGEFEIAYRSGILEDKWRSAYNILRNSNATIQNRYHGEGYQHSYWLYSEDRICRQKLKPKPLS